MNNTIRNNMIIQMFKNNHAVREQRHNYLYVCFTLIYVLTLCLIIKSNKLSLQSSILHLDSITGLHQKDKNYQCGAITRMTE